MFVVKLVNVKNTSEVVSIKEGDYISITFHNKARTNDFSVLCCCQGIEEALYSVENICQENGFNARFVGECRGSSIYMVRKNC